MHCQITTWRRPIIRRYTRVLFSLPYFLAISDFLDYRCYRTGSHFSIYSINWYGSRFRAFRSDSPARMPTNWAVPAACAYCAIAITPDRNNFYPVVKPRLSFTRCGGLFRSSPRPHLHNVTLLTLASMMQLAIPDPFASRMFRKSILKKKKKYTNCKSKQIFFLLDKINYFTF